MSDAVEPYRVKVAQPVLDDLRRRITQTRWPDELPGVGWQLGTPLGYLETLANYWAQEFDWRAAEEQINAFPQFLTSVDGTQIHLIHARSPSPHALPLLLTHGWPSSVFEFLDVISALADPASHGGDPGDAFHVVVAAIPGYGFSGPTREPGWNATRVADAWAELMSRLGYGRFCAQGGDWGSTISRQLARDHADRIIGLHLNMLFAMPSGAPGETETLSDEDRRRVGRMKRFLASEAGYMRLQSTRPQTLAYALTDSPVGQLAWIVEKFKEWTDCDNSPEEAIARDRMLATVTTYWVTRTAGSSARLYYETALSTRLPARRGTVPTGVAVFPADVQPARSLAERDENVVHWREFDRGGHFPAMEQPALFVDEIREFFRRFRGA